MSEIQKTTFSFDVKDGDSLLIVSLKGSVGFDFLSEVQTVSRKVLSFSAAKFVVLDMSGVVDVESKMTFSFAKIQKDIRDKGLVLRVCALSPRLKKKLAERGIVRESELCESLTQAVRSLLAKSGDRSKTNRGDPIAA